MRGDLKNFPIYPLFDELKNVRMIFDKILNIRIVEITAFFIESSMDFIK